MEMQRMVSIPILWININITLGTMLKFDANVNAGANVNIDAQCEQTLRVI